MRKPPAHALSPIWQVAVAMLLVALVVACRLMTGLPNFQPVLAVALFAGYYWGRAREGVLITVCAMLLSDFIAGFYQWELAIVVYLASVAPCFFGPWLTALRSRLARAGFVGLASIGSALLFFLATNGAVWLWSGWYQTDMAGLVKCLAAGLPFLKQTMASNVIFAAGLFGVAAAAESARVRSALESVSADRARPQLVTSETRNPEERE